jgi:hypothetical protein
LAKAAGRWPDRLSGGGPFRRAGGRCRHDVDRRWKSAAGTEQAAPVWSYNAITNTVIQHADWLPSPLAVSRLVTDLLLDRSGNAAR